MSIYGALLARPGARPLALACAAAWVSFASLGLAIVLVVAHSTRSFAAAGLAVGMFAGASGALAPLRGRLVDRRGRAALLGFALAHTLALGSLVVSAAAHWASVWPLLGAAAAGATAPPLIASARALWPFVAGPDLTRTGHALNAVIGDLGGVLGPLATAALAASLGPVVALGVLGSGPLLGAATIAALDLPIGRRRDRPPGEHRNALRRSPGMRTILACGAALGVVLGAVEVAAPALAQLEGAPGLAAIPLAAFAAGSVLSSTWAGHSRRAGSPQRRYAAGFALLALALTGCLLVRSISTLAVVLAAAGFGFGLVTVGTFELLDALAAEGSAVEAFTWLTTSEGIGIAIGSSAAGGLASRSPREALVLVALVAPLAAALALARRHTLTEPAPTSPSLAS